MKQKTKGTPIWSDRETREKLRILAQRNERDMSAHLRWLVNREWDSDNKQEVATSTIEATR